MLIYVFRYKLVIKSLILLKLVENLLFSQKLPYSFMLNVLMVKS